MSGPRLGARAWTFLLSIGALEPPDIRVDLLGHSGEHVDRAEIGKGSSKAAALLCTRSHVRDDGIAVLPHPRQNSEAANAVPRVPAAFRVAAFEEL
jgi:hypothetical protein